MNKILEKQIKETFIRALTGFKSQKDTIEFLDSFLTKKEFETLSKRLAVAYWLKKKRTNENIQENLKVSDKSISEVKKLMNNKNFQKGVDLLIADEWANKWSGKIKNIVRK